MLPPSAADMPDAWFHNRQTKNLVDSVWDCMCHEDEYEGYLPDGRRNAGKVVGDSCNTSALSGCRNASLTHTSGVVLGNATLDSDRDTYNKLAHCKNRDNYTCAKVASGNCQRGAQQFGSLADGGRRIR